MSFSFSIRAASKAAAKAAVAVELDKVVASQVVHERDRAQAQASADAYIDVLDDDDTKDVAIYVSGSLSGVWTESSLTSIHGANVSVGATLLTKAEAS